MEPARVRRRGSGLGLQVLASGILLVLASCASGPLVRVREAPVVERRIGAVTLILAGVGISIGGYELGTSKPASYSEYRERPLGGVLVGLLGVALAAVGVLVW